MLAVVAVAAGTVAGAGPAAACLGNYVSGDSHLEQMADVIFTGTAVRENDLGASSEWTFVVDGVEKGAVGHRASVTAWHEESMCGTGFNLGSRYRVLAGRHGFLGGLSVSSVGGTTSLGRPANAPPVEGVFIGPDLSFPAAIVGAVLALAVGVWLLRGHRREVVSV
jgi:hypothetical protein